jgi:hypothetical protein
MAPNLESGRRYGSLLLLLLIFGTTSAATGGQLARKSTRQGGISYFDSDFRPQLLNADSDPTLRYPILSMPGSVFSITYGWLDVTRNSVRYQVAQPPNKLEHSFEVPRSEINELTFTYSFVMFRSPRKRQMICYLPQSQWGSVHTAPGATSAASRGTDGSVSLYQALRDFDRVLALVKPPAPAPPPVAPQPVAALVEEPKPPAPPVIVLSAPSDAGANQVVEQDESPLVIRGVAMDSTGIPVVSINGSPANMRPQSAQSAEFWSEPLTLQPGGNRVEISATNTAHVETKLVFLVHYTPKAVPPNPRALDKQDIISLLQGGVPNTRIAEIIKDRGIKFSPSADDLNDIRGEGGNDELVQAIQQAALHP